MKERPILFSAPMVRAILDGRKTQTRRVMKPQPSNVDANGIWYRMPSGGESLNVVNCPYGQPEDRLWARESWQSHIGTFGESIVYAYRATDDDRLGPWRPSIFMPRDACRIVLEVTDVRVQRLQEINEADSIAEGITHSTLNDPRVEYRWLWESINGAGSWDSNPCVWAITFRRIEA